jgi:hypothetical protein
MDQLRSTFVRAIKLLRREPKDTNAVLLMTCCAFSSRDLQGMSVDSLAPFMYIAEILKNFLNAQASHHHLVFGPYSGG